MFDFQMDMYGNVNNKKQAFLANWPLRTYTQMKLWKSDFEMT